MATAIITTTVVKLKPEKSPESCFTGLLAGTREIMNGLWFAPDFDPILVLVRKILLGRDET